MTKYGRLSSTPTSWTRTTRLLSMRRSSRASLRNRSRTSAWITQLSARTFTATAVSSSGSYPFQTVANAPAPTLRSSR
jgi:hypothetical protein